ncbi:phage tail protein [Sphingomonas sp.]|uniref:phage tail protein n=1 Tax=Sphingomonas sp. TaxID=28214 RepID=UPI002C38626F|nr:tail fiber protein [Sphingomonas sp.]HWK34795.1 tail fiber protein [Sphingomonas sp.]
MTGYVGEIRMFGGNFAPLGWAFCNGALLPIAENDTLFNLIGTTFGGDGQSTFGLPDLCGRAPVHLGTSSSGTAYALGQKAGVEQVTLLVQQLPSHSHPFLASGAAGTSAQAAGQVLAALSAVNVFRPGAPNVPLHPQSTSMVGNSQPHDNMQPYLCVNYIISLFGIYPSQN